MGRKPFVRDRILHAAFDRFAVRGYEAVSTRDIAEAAEVGSASMFKHFATKEALGRAVYEVALAPILKQFAELAASAPEPRAAASAAVGLLYTAYDERPRMLALLVFPPHDLTPWEVDRANPAAVRSVLQRLTRLDDDGEAVLWGAITGPIQDRFLRRRDGLLAPLAARIATRISSLIPVNSNVKETP